MDIFTACTLSRDFVNGPQTHWVCLVLAGRTTSFSVPFRSLAPRGGGGGINARGPFSSKGGPSVHPVLFFILPPMLVLSAHAVGKKHQGCNS